ncbi:hypothetical protein RFI_06161 [Reticulomyxa filosa]|uniref:Uncharacterized protein n=1 Tax=Reticulomyxa filosa TaxID=46433 RepID=X6NYB0_RETFI|nr:hypothetical protein RFI_06161 [Reticulomyxa filosa]|eukprot:ETO30956.1 hypothetical protein RFI_06161 [Reticulomyxa filosa]
MNNLKIELLKKDEQVIELRTDINRDINNLRYELQKKDETINAIKLNNIEFKKQLEQYQIRFDEYKENIKSKIENQTTNIQQLQLQTNTQIKDEEQKEKEKEQYKNCTNTLSFIQSSNLKNRVDFLLITENYQRIKLKNNEWNNYKFGIFLLGENITLIPDCEKLGHLKIKTSHLWIKYSSSKIDCSQLGYPQNQGPGKGGFGYSGGGYGTKGEGNSGESGREMYGEETLLKEIHFGSGGGGNKHGGSGGGIIELIIEQQLINHGSIQSNGGDGFYGGGSGGSILIELQSNKLKQTFGTVTCIGGNQNEEYKGGKGRIAMYGIELSLNDIKQIDPIPFNRLHK